MKSRLSYLFALAVTPILAFALVSGVNATTLSPGLDVIAENSAMIKSGTASSGITFTLDEFKTATNSQLKSGITVTSLPDKSEGTLMLGTVAVSAGQALSADSLDRLRFVPSSGTESSAFTFSLGNSYRYECVIKVIADRNSAPSISEEKSASVWTQKNISYYGTLSGYDPDGDSVIYEIVDYPVKGIVAVTNRASGDFKYTPYASVGGNDSFSYRVRDEFGNYSPVAIVNIEIEAPASKLVFEDMKEHWALNAALVMTSKGIISAESIDGKMYFSPDEKVTRAEFLKMAMDTLGADNVPAITKTIFADDPDIADEFKGYVAAAYSLGIIHGINEETGLYFRPNDPVTRSEAAVVLNNIIGADVPAVAPVFSDSDAVPSWAKNAIYALNSLGIIGTTGSGNVSAHGEMDRAQCAQLLFGVTRVVK